MGFTGLPGKDLIGVPVVKLAVGWTFWKNKKIMIEGHAPIAHTGLNSWTVTDEHLESFAHHIHAVRSYESVQYELESREGCWKDERTR